MFSGYPGKEMVRLCTISSPCQYNFRGITKVFGRSPLRCISNQPIPDVQREQNHRVYEPFHRRASIPWLIQSASRFSHGITCHDCVANTRAARWAMIHSPRHAAVLDVWHRQRVRCVIEAEPVKCTQDFRPYITAWRRWVKRSRHGCSLLSSAIRALRRSTAKTALPW